MQQPKSDQGRLIVEVPRSHIFRHKPGRLLYTSDQLVTVAVTYTTHKHKGRITMLSVGYEVAISANRTAADLIRRPRGHRDQLRRITVYHFLSWCGDTVSLHKEWKMNEYKELVEVRDREIQNYSERCLSHLFTTNSHESPQQTRDSKERRR